MNKEKLPLFKFMSLIGVVADQDKSSWDNLNVYVHVICITIVKVHSAVV